ncbi:hypothetical protein DCO49_00150 [Stenotrophomonas sp. SPM]|uniref:hypothetical protein n=1 Tax=Stenotrophomonas sp. SPM TaxID=2170735 RepID=UPI000DE70242|nr:hypothetical protein [Stenotrophomonas sp. SPM]PWB29818.1 hypothetical protein DCO49_00150 [Stenotrophomonas sp. SPM]
MRAEKKKIEGDLTLTDGLALYGQASGNIVVTNGGELHLYGVCGRNLTVQEGGKAIIYGMVSGHVVNDGGYLQVLGTIVGSLRSPSGNTEVNPNASVIGGRG